MDSLETNVILKFKRLCDCWLCQDCGCENSIADSVCLVCGADRAGEDLVIHAGEEGPVNSGGSHSDVGGGPSGGSHSGGHTPGGGYTPGGGGHSGGYIPGGGSHIPDDDYGSGSGSNIGLIVAIIFIVIAVIAVSVGILLYQ